MWKPKALYFVLLPWYLKYLPPGEFGIIALASTFSTLLGLLLQLNLNGSVFRYYLDQSGEDARQQLVGTLILFQVAWATLVVVTVQIFGGVLSRLFTDVPFHPYLRLATWLAFTASLPVIPLAVLQMQHEAGLYRGLTFLGFLLNTAGVAWFVVGRRGGAYGFLLGQVLAGLAMVAAYAIVIVRRIRIEFGFPILRECLTFSLPLVPYALGGWVMDMSNRYLIGRFLDLGEVGRYNLGYQFALVLQAILNAFALAWLPVFYHVVKGERSQERLARFGKLYWCLTLLIALLIVTFAKEFLGIFVDA